MQAMIIKADGTKVYAEPQYGTKFTLEEMQRMVGGYVEKVGKYEKYNVFGDEDGMPKELPVNETASQMLGYTVVGDIVFCPRQLFTF